MGKSWKSGLDAEDKVIELFCQRGCCLIAQRIKLFNVEVDLLFSKEGKKILVEVKKMSSSFMRDPIISEHQRIRLHRVYNYLLQCNDQAEFYLALVKANGEVELIEADGVFN